MRRSSLILLLILAVALFLLRFMRDAGQRSAQRAAVVHRDSSTGSSAAVSASVASSASGASKPSAAAGPRHDSGNKVLSGPWGGQAGQFGRRHDPESNPEAPMAVAAGAGGELLVLDQINRRVERYRGSERQSSIALGGDTLQDLTPGTQGRVVVLDRLVESSVAVYGADGRLENELALDAKVVGEGGALTGVFADREGIYVERDHGTVVRIGDAAGNRDRPPEELPGRPTRDGQLYITAAIVDRVAGQVAVNAVQRLSQKPAFSVTVQLGAPILHLLLLDSDPQGRIYVAAATGTEAAEPPYPILDEAIIALQLGSGGTPRGRLVLPPLTGADESFRPLSIDDQGAVLLMRARPEGLLVTRHVFP